jgi:histidinol-phosphatase (PHP family)
MIPHDYHMHTRFSPDSKADMSDMCAAAVAKGVAEIGFTEHYDLHPDENPRDWLNLDRWVEELECCRTEFAGHLIIRAGIEIGEPHLFVPETRQMLARYPFDYALGSLHWVGSGNVFTADYFERTPEEAFGSYFEELERMTQTGEFHIALEINAGTLRRSAAILTPGPPILEWYAEMGGLHLTLGSDAHRAEHVGSGLDTALAAAKTAGLKHLTRFVRGQGQLIPMP